MTENITRINRDRKGGHMLSELPDEDVYNTGRQGRKAQKRWKMKKLRQQKTKIIAEALDEWTDQRIEEEADLESWYNDYDDDWDRDYNDRRWDDYYIEGMKEVRDFEDDTYDWAYDWDYSYNDEY